MFGFGLRKVYTGLDIGRSGVVAAQVSRTGERWKILNLRRVPFPPETLRCVYRSRNILNREAFGEVVRKALGPKITRVGLSLPNEIIKVSIERFDELPGSRGEINRMLAWSTEKSLHLPGESIKVSHHLLEKRRGQSLLVATSIRDVVSEYESALGELGVQARVVRPGGINQFNFFSRELPEKNVVAFAGLFDNFLSFYVLEGGRIIFYQEIKKELLNESIFEDIDMMLQYYMSEGSRRKIGMLFMGNRSGIDLSALGESLLTISGVELKLIDESCIAEWGEATLFPESGASVAAIGAAQSLAQQEG